MSEHTPTPWKVGLRHSAQGVPVLAGRGYGYVVTRIYGHSTSDAKDEANAAFIVEAVNNYDALRARCSDLEAALGRRAPGWGVASISADDPRNVTIEFETAEQAAEFVRNLKQ